MAPASLTPSEHPETATRKSGGGSAVRGILLRLGLVIVALLLPLLVLELTLRIFGPIFPGNYSTGKYLTADPTYGRFHVLNFTGWLRTEEFVSYLRINSEGLRGPEIPSVKPAGSFRILALGDSYLEAAQVREDQSVAGLLASSLSAANGRTVDVVNSGVGSWGTTHEWLFLEHAGERFQPDLQLVLFHPANDLWDNSYSLQRPQTPREPFFTLGDDGSLKAVPFRLAQRPFRNELDPNDLTPRGILSRTSWLYHVVETGVLDKLGDDATGPRLNTAAMAFWDPRAEDRVKPTWDVTLALFKAIAEHGRAQGIPTIIAVVPSSSEVYDEDWQATQARIRSARLQPTNYERFWLTRVLERRQHEVPAVWVDLGPALRAAAAATGERMYFKQDGHWTVAGNAVVASALQATISQYIPITAAGPKSGARTFELPKLPADAVERASVPARPNAVGSPSRTRGQRRCIFRTHVLVWRSGEAATPDRLCS
jgi:hypothetical protein